MGQYHRGRDCRADPALVAALEVFHRAGRPVALVVIGGEPPAFDTNGLTVYNVPAGIAWTKSTP